MDDIVIAAGARTAIGDFGGAFKRLLCNQMLVPVIKEVMSRAGIEGPQVDDVIIGCCAQNTAEPNLDRTTALLAGLPKKVRRWVRRPSGWPTNTASPGRSRTSWPCAVTKTPSVP